MKRLLICVGLVWILVSCSKTPFLGGSGSNGVLKKEQRDSEATRQETGKPSDNGEGVPGYLTDPTNITVWIDRNSVSVTAGAGTIETDSGDGTSRVPYSIWQVPRELLEMSYGSSASELTLSGVRVATGYAAADGSFAAQFDKVNDDPLVFIVGDANNPEDWDNEEAPTEFTISLDKMEGAI